MIIYMINYDNMLRIRHEHTSHDDILNIPPWSKHLPRMPHSPQKLRRFCSEQACKRCERRSRGRFPIFWSQFHEFALSRCLRQKISASNFFTVSICLLLFAVSQAPTTRMTRNRTFLKRAMPPCRALPALPATLEPMHRVNALLVPLWSFTVLLCLPFSMKQNTETKTSENQRLFWAVHCGCGTCLYSRDKSTNSRSCFGLKP